ncbi:hypothetical protein PPSC2_26845 (plasmid) [Paenibacillus polymyxa SC2]|uniref:Uncharacterized protein n=1 Tax=Paenibacillus polymyxa (strain SC2) TaxID=886882 RepID=A0A0D5ZCA0_PAEPS|nr:hypothetical protein PPSC2_26845 [Paenibacillus polymyxa SC2]
MIRLLEKINFYIVGLLAATINLFVYTDPKFNFEIKLISALTILICITGLIRHRDKSSKKKALH